MDLGPLYAGEIFVITEVEASLRSSGLKYTENSAYLSKSYKLFIN